MILFVEIAIYLDPTSANLWGAQVGTPEIFHYKHETLKSQSRQNLQQKRLKKGKILIQALALISTDETLA